MQVVHKQISFILQAVIFFTIVFILKDFLLKLPGVTVKNYRTIMNKVHNLAELFTMSEETLSEIMGNSAAAKQLHSAIHITPKQDKEKQVDNRSKVSKDYKKGVKRKR